MENSVRIVTPRDRARAIIKEAADEYGVEYEALVARRTLKPFRQARRVAIVRIRDRLQFTNMQIARIFNLTDHTTIVHHLKLARELGER